MTVRGKSDPHWSALVEKWKGAQSRLRERMIVATLERLPRFVVGADCAFSDDKQTIFAAAVIYDRKTQRIIEVAHAARRSRRRSARCNTNSVRFFSMARVSRIRGGAALPRIWRFNWTNPGSASPRAG